MAQEIINYGNTVNDGTGDPLRDAFIKVDDNFTQIWAAGPVGSNITVLNNTISVVNTNGNLILSPNGIGIIQTNRPLYPRLDNTYDLGSADLRYRSIFVGAGGIINGGNLTLGNISNLKIPGGVNGYVIQTDGAGNLSFVAQSGSGSGGVIQSSTAPADPTDNTLWWDEVSGRLYVYYTDADGSQWVDAAPAAASTGGSGGVIQSSTAPADPNSNTLWWDESTGRLYVYYTDADGSQWVDAAPAAPGSTYGNANVANYLSVYSGSLSGNSLSLLSGSNLWAINGNVLTFPTGARWTSDTNFNDEYITSGIDGYLNFSTFDVGSNVATELKMEHGLIRFNIYNGNNAQWTFNIDGSSQFPGDLLPLANLSGNLGSSDFQWKDLWVSNNTIYINSVPITLGAGNVLQVNGEALLSNNSDASITTTGNITADYFIGDGSQLTNLPLDASQIENGTSNVAIATANGNVTVTANSTQAWTFSTNGNLQFPDGTTYTGSEIDSPAVPEEGSLASAGEAGITYLSGDFSKWAIFSENAFTVGVWTDVLIGWTVTDNEGFTDIIAGRGGFGAASFQTTVNNWPAPASGKTYVFTSPDYQPGYTNPVEITVGSSTWTFGNTGTLTTPGNITTTGSVTADNFFGNTEGLTGNITNLVSLNFDVENISARGNAGVNIGAGGFNNLVVLETDVLVQNVPLSVTGNVTANSFIGNGSQLTNLPITYTNLIENGNSNVAISTADSNVTVTANTATWSFETGDSALGEFDELPVLRTPDGSGSVIYNETLMAILAGNIDAGERSSVRLLEGGVSLLGTTSLDGELSTIIMEVNTGGVGIRALGDAAPRLSVTGNVTGGNILTAGSVTANNISTGNVVATRVQNDGNLEIRSNVAGTIRNWTFDSLGDFNTPPTGNIGVGGRLSANTITAEGNVSATGNVSGNFFIGNGSQLTGIAASYGNANVATFLAAYGSNTVVTTGNITGGNLISSATIFGNVDVVLGNIANAAGTKTRMVTDTEFSYIQTGNGTIGSTGNIVFSPYSSPTQQVVIDTANGNLTAAGNVTAQNFIGNISITGNVQGTSANVTLVAGAYDWTFDNTGNVTLPGNTFAVNYANGTPVDIITRFEGSWNVATGNTTQSFTVDGNNTYQMWVEGNIPNGIIVWNATVTVTNTNVPVIGQQFAWNYEGGGNILMFNSIPAQIIGTAGAISNAEPAVGNTTNVFSFGINNASGNVANVRYGWIKIS